MRRISPIILLMLLSACLSTPTPPPTSTPEPPLILTSEENPYAPQPGDEGLQIGGVILTSIDLSERTDLSPPRVQLNLLGSMPSVCNDLRIEVNPPNANFQIHLEVYSLIDPDINCENVFQLFEARILFGVYSPGRFTVWINNGLIGDFIAY